MRREGESRCESADELTGVYVQERQETNAFQPRTIGRVTLVLLLKATALIQIGKPKSNNAAL